jgi:hypothetical protein
MPDLNAPDLSITDVFRIRRRLPMFQCGTCVPKREMPHRGQPRLYRRLLVFHGLGAESGLSVG